MTQQGNIQVNQGYTIQKGDTLEVIAQRAYNNDSRPFQLAIYKMNQRAIGGDSSVLPLGATIWIPIIGHPPQTDIVYIVHEGDTLSGIAQQTYNNGSVLYRTAICRINKLATCDDPNAIHPGDPLYLPPISNPSPSQNTFYIVQDRDKLSSIAQQAYHNRNKTELISQCVYNKKGRIKPGEILCIPFDPSSKQLPPNPGNIHGPDNLP
jgi:LysM domain